MKKLILLLFCGLLLTGCSAYGTSKSGTEQEGYLLYFQERELQEAAGGGALRAEEIQLPAEEYSDAREVARALIYALLDGPQDESLKSTIPAGVSLMSLELDGTRAMVDLSAAYGTLSGVALTLADQAVALTLTQLPEILTVKITVHSRELGYRDKQLFSGRDVLLAPEGDVVSTVDALLYFLSEEGELTPEERTLELYEGDTQVGAVVRAVEHGPAERGFTAVLPEGFRVKSVWLEEKVCYVNLSSGHLETVIGDYALPMAIESIAKSLCSLESVHEVRFLVDGDFAQWYGAVNVAAPYME